MPVNSKKNIRLKNRTLYFSPDKDCTHVCFSSPKAYRSVQSKIEGYESRLYWQFRYCQDFNGQVFYYTLTYNNKSIPYYYGTYCFDYEHLRDLLTGGFRKILLRRFGTTFKYFIGAELGDGKGKRGLHNNPHYHVLFFLEPSSDPKFSYRKITPIEFRHLVRLYWQGFDEDVTGFRSYKTAKYGSVKEGENYGLVTDFRAIMYCAKYVCKDVGLINHESKVETFLRFKYRNQVLNNGVFHQQFFHDEIYKRYNVPLDSKCSKWLYSDFDLLLNLLPDVFSGAAYVFGEVPFSELIAKKFLNVFLKKENLVEIFYKYLDSVVDPLVREGLNEWRNRFSNKCRISHGVGDYALQFIDKLDPVVSVPSKFGFKNRPIGLYYYRKLYYDIVRPVKKSKVHEKPCVYSPVRVINDDGIAFKVHRLKTQVDRLVAQVESYVDILDSDLFSKLKDSDVNTEVFCSFETFKRLLENEKCKRSIYESYSFFKLVYKDRFFKVQLDPDTNEPVFPKLSYFDDYACFLRSSFSFVDRSDIMLDSFLESGCAGYLSYSSHPDFLPYSVLFSVFDLLADYFFVQADDEAQRKAEEIKKVKRFYDQRKLKTYYYGTTVV